jgi:transcriptional regulator of heat shock response
MEMTERQEQILNTIVREYIDSAQPIGSQLLEKKYNFGICPATIRIEMQKLTDSGFLHQPHTSAGRVPTDKGYRFYVDNLLRKEFLEEKYDLEIENLIEKEIGDTIKFLRSLTKSLAAASSNLALSYLYEEKVLWKEGWEGLFQEPEFRERKIISNFSKVIKNLEEEIETLKINSGLKVYIGKEAPFLRAKEFSIIISGCHLPKRERAILAILGPKRMAYEKSICSLNSLTKVLERF